MSEPASTDLDSPLLAAVQLRPVTIDELSNVRHLHALAIRRLAASHLSEAEIEAFTQHVYSEAYSARLSDVVYAKRLTAALLAGELVATAGWIPANDAGAVARLMAVFVSPLYAGQGIARRIVTAVEDDARQAGFAAFTIRSPVGATGFFGVLGYEVASHGVWPLTRETALPVAFMRKIDVAPLSPKRRGQTGAQPE